MNLSKLVFTSFSLILTLFVSAQESNALSKIKHSEPGQGTIKIEQSAAVANVVAPEGVAPVQTIPGYRVQVFAGNHQSSSKRMASEREGLVLADFSELKTYVTFKAPFWRLRAGDFNSYEEADALMRQLKQKGYPFAKEMFVIKDDIIVGN